MRSPAASTVNVDKYRRIDVDPQVHLSKQEGSRLPFNRTRFPAASYGPFSRSAVGDSVGRNGLYFSR